MLLQVPLTAMILQDPQSLSLGAWNLRTFALFCAATFAVVPAAAGALFAAAARASPRLSFLALSMAAAYVLTMQINFHYLQVHFLDAPWRRFALGGLALGITGVGWAARERFLRLLGVCARLSPVVFILFAVQARPDSARAPWPTPAGGGTAGLEGNAGPSNADGPVFFLTFEKLCSSYVADGQGRIWADRLPRLARFVSESDYYPETHANCTATVYSLKTLYSGRVWTSQRNWARQPNLRDILGRNRKAVMQLDVLTDYCDPRRNVCLRAIGVRQMRGVDLISGWYRTYAHILLPDPLKQRLSLAGWSFNPWFDMWGREETERLPGEEVYQAVGRHQWAVLKEEIRRQGDAPNLYIMHSFISDGPPVKASGLSGSGRDRYAQELEGATRNLALFDAELGMFFNFLREQGLYDRSLIVITSDTGYDHDSRRVMGDPELPYSRDLTRVFFALKRPGQKEGRVFRPVLRQVDVLPTLLSHLGIDPAPYRFEGVAVTDPGGSATLGERPLDFFLTSEKAGLFHYRLESSGAPLLKVRKVR